jgi:stringent starvation protein B
VENLMNAPDSTSTRPYLIRALYEWCTDNGLTPYVAVAVDETVQVPFEYVKNNEIVLNISFDATSSLELGNEFIAFKARFAGSAREIMVPISRVIAIYARENGQGMAFPLFDPLAPAAPTAGSSPATPASSQLPPVSEDVAQRGATGVESKIVQLVPGSGMTPDGDDPKPPKPKQGKRPALKRVK